MMPRRHAGLFVSAFILLSTQNEVRAATTSESLTVKAVVQLSCSISSSSLDFGSYTSGQTTDLKAQAAIGYSRCPASQVKLELDGGQSKNAASRTMLNGTNKLGYQLYSDAARSKVLGSGSTALSFTTVSAGAGSVVVYGTIAASQVVPAGSYTDTVNITLTF